MKFRKLLAMVLAVAMIASLAPVLRTTAKAEDGVVEWTWDGGNSATFTFTYTDTSSTGAKSASVTYNGINYPNGKSAKIDRKGSFKIIVPSGGGKLLVAYGEGTPGVANLKLTNGSNDKSGKGKASTAAGGDTAYVYEVELTEGTWTLTRDNAEYWVAYMFLSPLGPGVSSEIDSDSLKLEKDESGNFSGSATATVTVSNYEGDNWEFKAISADDSKVKVTFAEATKDSDVNGTYTLTITPVKDAETGEVNIYAGVVTKGKTPTKAEDFDKCATIPVTISQKSSTGGGGTGGSVTYHLNIPSDAKIDGVNNADDYLYVDSDPSTVKELHDNDITDFRVGGTGAKASDNDNLETYKTKSMIGDYYFVGWSKTKVEKLDGESYKNIDFPVVNMEDDKSTNHRFIYVDTSIKGKYSTADITDLYAVWTTENNSGLFGYTMQLPGATFPGVDYLSTAPDNWHISGTNTRLGDNGTGGNKTWQKFTVLDEGHKNDDNKPLTVEVPNTQVINSDGTWNFSGWFNKAVAKSGDRNKDYLYAPDGLKTITGAAKTVLYSGNHAIYSLDAIWSRVTAPVDQTVLYKEDGNKPSFDGLGVKLVGGKYDDSHQKDAWEKIFGTNSYDETDKTVTNENLKYYVTVTGPGTIPAGFDGSVGKTLSEVQALTLTKPGKYTIEVHAKLEGVDATNGNGGTATSVNFDFGTITFNYTIIPQLTVEVTKELTGRDWKPGESFIFNVEADNSATVKDSPITITKADDHKSAVVSFGEITEASGYREYKITITETTSGETGMDYAKPQDITVKLDKAADGTYTLSGDGINPDPASDGNYKTAVTMTNAYKSGSLTVTKEVAPSNTSKGAGPFTITVTFTGWTPPTDLATGNDQITSVVGSTVTLSLGKGESVTINNIPVGVTYTVEESDSQGATVSYSVTGGSGTIAAGNSNNVTVTNTYPAPTGKLTITKTVDGTNHPTTWEFTFKVKAPSGVTFDRDADYGTGVTYDSSDGTLKVTLKNGAASVTIENLPIGTYTVTEDVPAGYEFNVTGDNVTRTSGENAFTAAITEDGTTTAAVTNTFLTGDLTINKKVEGTNAPASDEFEFTIKAADDATKEKVANETFDSVHFDANGVSATVTITTASKAGSVIIKNLPFGEYTVTEQDKDHYTQYPASQTVTLDQDSEEITFTNTYDQPTGNLTITKTVEGVASASGQEFTFTITAPEGKIANGTSFTVTGATAGTIIFNGGTATVTVKMDADLTKTVTIANLPAGEYTVKETAMADNYTVDGADSKTVTITGGSTEIVAITNKHDTGDLTITKNVTGGTNVKVSQTFTFTVQAQANLIKEGASFDVSNGTSAKFNGGEAEVTVTLSNSDTGSVTIEGLPVGEYTITEKEAQGYTIPDPVTVNVAKGTTPVPATITNELQTAELTVEKAELKHDPNVDLPTDPTFTFTVAFKDFPAGVTSFDLNVGGTSQTVTTADNTVIVPLKAGVQTELKNIPKGIGYEVTEAFQSDDLGRHFTTKWVNRTGTLNSSTTVTCTNTYHMLEKGNGALVIRKEAVGGQAGTVYQFKVTFTQGGRPYTGQIGGKTLGSDGSATFEMDDTINHVLVIQVPVGVTYKVEEVFASGERPKAISVGLEQNEAGDSTSGETASGTISQEFNYDSVIFTNSYLGDLTISKTVPQFDGGEEFTFTVTLPTGTYNYTGDKSGTISSGGTVTLKAGESITIQNLPAGSTYTVTEAGTANYTAEASVITGTIANNTTAAAAFTNNRNTGSLTVNKTLTGKLAVAANEEFTFTVTLTGVGAGFNGDCGGVKFEDGVGTITITGAGSETITGLPVGAGFTVKEQDASGYVTTYNNDPANHDKAEGTISANPTTVTVNNDKPDTGTITITKVVKNAPAADANKIFNFTITLYLDEDLINVATDINGEHSGFNFTNGVAPFTLRNGQSIQGAGEVTVGEGRLFYKIEEETNSNYKTEYSVNGKSKQPGSVVTGEFTQDSQNTTVTFTNTYNYGDLTITKAITDDSGASHANDKFTFTITKVGDSTFNQKVEINGANSETVLLPAGEYIVTETAGKGDSVAYRVGTSGASAANAEVTITAGGTVAVTVTNTYYSGGGTGGTGGGTGGTPSPDIDTSEHYGYIIGVTHTEVAPEQNITRAEIATILFRLLTDEARAANWSENSGFPDVKSGVWYNHAVAVLHKMGIILGDDNGNFNPDQNITRAEVAAMVVRFYEVAEGTVLNNRFTDVETTKWYAEAVLLADYYGLMQGDGDTFKPEDLLTRAEAMTVFNRLLGRKPHKDHLHKDMITWTDNTDKNKWYYAEVQEATNSHTCGNNVVIDGKTYETWSAITKMRDWAALEY